MRRLLVGAVIGLLLLASAPSAVAVSGRPGAAAGVWSWELTEWTDGRTVGTSAWAPPDATMTGTWVILGGTGGLSGVHGHGSWTYTGAVGDLNSADYAGRVQVPHH